MKELGLMYIIIYKNLKEKSYCQVVGKKETYYVLGAGYHVPKEMRTFVLREMKIAGLITEINKTGITLNEEINIQGIINNHLKEIKKFV